MNKKELIMATLTKMGYSPEIDNDGDIKVRYQMKSIFVLYGDEEDSYISIIFPQFFEIEEDKEMISLAVCNKLTRDIKMAKVFIDQTFKHVSTTCEFFYVNEESLEQNIDYSLKMLGVIRSIFLKELADLSED